jgi:hypothetical protein
MSTDLVGQIVHRIEELESVKSYMEREEMFVHETIYEVYRIETVKKELKALYAVREKWLRQLMGSESYDNWMHELDPKQSEKDEYDAIRCADHQETGGW